MDKNGEILQFGNPIHHKHYLQFFTIFHHWITPRMSVRLLQFAVSFVNSSVVTVNIKEKKKRKYFSKRTLNDQHYGKNGNIGIYRVAQK